MKRQLNHLIKEIGHEIKIELVINTHLGHQIPIMIKGTIHKGVILQNEFHIKNVFNNQISPFDLKLENPFDFPVNYKIYLLRKELL